MSFQIAVIPGHNLCNIPLVNIGVISVEGAPEINVHETHYGEECFTTQCQLNTS